MTAKLLCDWLKDDLKVGISIKFYSMVVKSVSLKIEPLQYIAIYYNGSIFNETDFKNLNFGVFKAAIASKKPSWSYKSVIF